MGLTFYHMPMSTSCLTEDVLAELAIEVEVVTLNIAAGDTRKPDYLKLNPNGKVPLIVHDDVPIWESAAITMYLGETFGVERGLYPEAGPKRGQAMMWISWTGTTMMFAAGHLHMATKESADGQPTGSKTDIEKAKAKVNDCLKILEESLEGKDFLLGKYCLADTHLNAITDWVQAMKVDFAPYPNVVGWAKRCKERPNIKKLREEVYGHSS